MRPGLHITTLGPDQPGKCEIAADALGVAKVVVDDRRLAVDMGAVGGAGSGRGAIHAELREVLAGIRPGRESDEEVTVFGSVSLTFQDLAAGSLAYNLAREAGIGRSIDLMARRGAGIRWAARSNFAADVAMNVRFWAISPNITSSMLSIYTRLLLASADCLVAGLSIMADLIKSEDMIDSQVSCISLTKTSFSIHPIVQLD